jgi:hypothetical protein
MGLDYSQKRLISAPLHSKHRSKQMERLQIYAFFTGLASTMISFAAMLIEAFKH